MPNQGRGVYSKDVEGDLQFYRADETAILRIGGDGTDTDGAVLKIGSSTTPASTPLATEVASQSMVRMIFGIDHDGGYGFYTRSFVRAAAISGDAARIYNTVYDVAGATARGLHASLSFGTSGKVTGLGAAIEATLHLPSTAGATGSLYAVKAAINSDAATSDPAGATILAYLGIVNQGDATGGADVDDDAVLLHIDGHTIANGNLVEAVGTAYALAEFTHSIRIKIGSTLYYIPISNLAASAT